MAYYFVNADGEMIRDTRDYSIALTDEEGRMVKAVLSKLRRMSSAELDRIGLGSITEGLAWKLESKLHYLPYCKEHGINYEEMTEDDFVNEWLER